MESGKLGILVCCDEFPPKVWGGMSRSVESIVNGLSALSCQVDVITHKRQANVRGPCITGVDHRSECKVIWCRYPLCPPTRIAQLVNVFDYDLLYVNGRGFAHFAVHASEDHHTKLVYSSRSNFYEEVNYGSYAFDKEKAQLQNMLVTTSDKIVVASISEMHLLRERYQLDPQRICVIPNPLHPRFLEKPMTPLQRRLGRVLFVGRYVEQKGLSYLLEAIPKVIEQNPDAHFVFAGGHGNQRVMDLLSYTQSQFGYKIELKGWLSLEDLIAEYYQSQVVVIPSLYEPFGNVALEAMACGCAVVATSIGGLAEIITDRSTGLLVNPADSDMIALAVLELLGNNSLAQHLGREAQGRVTLDYSHVAIARRLLHLFSGLVESRSDTFT